MPWHARSISDADTVIDIIRDILGCPVNEEHDKNSARITHIEIQYSCIVVILSREERGGKIRGVDILRDCN